MALEILHRPGSVRFMRSFGGAVLFLVCVVAACSSSDSDKPAATATTGTGAATIGTAGGTVTSADGNVTLTVPAGALAANTNVTIAPVTATIGGHVGTAYDFGPNGTSFAAPATIAIKVDPSFGDAASLAVGLYSGGPWIPLASPAFDGKSVSGTTPHLSIYALVSTADAAVFTPDAGVADTGTDSGGACATTCTGCCDANNVCHADGATNVAYCGVNGLACETCPSPPACRSGLCVVEK